MVEDILLVILALLVALLIYFNIWQGKQDRLYEKEVLSRSEPTSLS